ncbi:Repeat domain in Vibrio, Colwellia, Bradyrhizobium and Shewanella [uncultured archaeon]|nr:Repeat domain in Vibrio, Colwellia, Bradyrhizobium and Shewanella [uncultured archaeon]
MDGLAKKVLILIVLISFASCVSAAYLADWPMARKDSQHSGATAALFNRSSSQMRLLWFYQASAAFLSEPVVSDVDGSPGLEVLIGDIEGNIYCFSKGGQLLWVKKMPDRITSPLAVVKTQSRAMIFAAVSDGKIRAFSGSGTLVWEVDAGKKIDKSPVTVADITGELNPVVIVQDLVLTTEGRPSSLTLTNVLENGITPLYGDYQYVLIQKPQNRTYVKIDSVDGILPAYADLNKDGKIEAITAYSDGKTPAGYYIKATDLQGNEIWKYEGAHIAASPSIGDIDGDGSLEIIFPAEDSSLHILRPSGAEAYSIPTQGLSGYAPAIADINGDGYAEIAVASHLGGLYVFGYPLETPSTDENNGDKTKTENDSYITPLLLLGGGALAIILVFILGHFSMGTELFMKRSDKRTPGKATIKNVAGEIRKQKEAAREVDVNWGNTVAQEVGSSDPVFTHELLNLILKQKAVKSSEAARYFSISHLKVANAATELEKRGFIEIDAHLDKSDPILRPKPGKF